MLAMIAVYAPPGSAQLAPPAHVTPAESAQRTAMIDGAMIDGAMIDGASIVDRTGGGVRDARPARPRLLRSSLWTLAAFGAATAAMVPLDQTIAREFEEPERRRSATVARAASVFRTLGGSGVFVLSTGTYAAGRLTRREGLADAGLHATEAIVVSAAVSGIIKGVAGRARPYAVGGADADEFRFGRGSGSNTAFPSGHTTVAFAAAAAAQTELSQSAFGQSHSALVRFAAPLLYGSAALVGVSRLYHDKHWATDVVAGAAIGTVTGRVLVRRQHAGSPGRLERWLVPTVAPARGGGAVAWTATFR